MSTGSLELGRSHQWVLYNVTSSNYYIILVGLSSRRVTLPSPNDNSMNRAVFHRTFVLWNSLPGDVDGINREATLTVANGDLST